MDLIKTLMYQLVKMYNEYMDFKTMNNNYFTLDFIYDFLQKKYNISIDLSDLIYIINNVDLSLNKYNKTDLSDDMLNLLSLYDLKYLGNTYFRIKIKTIKNNHSIKKSMINYIIINYKGGDKQYNIILFKNKNEYLILNRYLNKTKKIRYDKKRTFFKNNKYRYQICKNKVLRKKEHKIIKGKKYSHNFKNKNKINDTIKNTYLDLIIDDIKYYNNDYQSYIDLISIYYSKYDLNTLKVDLINYIEYLLNLSESYYIHYDNNDKLKEYNYLIKSIKTFICALNDYDFKFIDDTKSNFNDYDNYNYNIKDTFMYHHNTNDKI